MKKFIFALSLTCLTAPLLASGINHFDRVPTEIKSVIAVAALEGATWTKVGDVAMVSKEWLAIIKDPQLQKVLGFRVEIDLEDYKGSVEDYKKSADSKLAHRLYRETKVRELIINPAIGLDQGWANDMLPALKNMHKLLYLRFHSMLFADEFVDRSELNWKKTHKNNPLFERLKQLKELEIDEVSPGGEGPYFIESIIPDLINLEKIRIGYYYDLPLQKYSTLPKIKEITTISKEYCCERIYIKIDGIWKIVSVTKVGLVREELNLDNVGLAELNNPAF